MMENGITDTFNSFQDYLLKEQEIREVCKKYNYIIITDDKLITLILMIYQEIRNCVREIDKHARDIAVILQNIHSNHEEENDSRF